MKCFGCQRDLEVGDHYIEDTASDFIDAKADPDIDGLIADLFGGRGGKVVICEACTQHGGDYLFETVYGGEEAA